MAWTEDRVEILKKLWAEGLSASQIAKQLGGVTRNAVIGKVHRLGLSGRATPSRPQRRTVTRSSRPRESAATTRARSKPSAPRTPVVKAAPPPPPLEAEKMANGEYATVLTLKESMCKWPIGDPAETTFRFCGRKSGPGQAYCEAHANMAFQPQSKRRRKPSDDARAVLDSLQATRRVNF